MEGAVTTGMEAITSGITAIMSVSSTILDAILAHPVYAALFASGFISIGIGIVGKLKRV